MSDLTPEETLRRSVHRETPDGGDVSLQDALAAVAAERERIVKLLRDGERVVGNLRLARAYGAAADLIEREGFRDE